MSLIKNALPRPGTESYNEQIRRPPKQQFPQPLNWYHPIWGARGEVQTPRVASSATWIPPARRENPDILSGSRSWQEHPILSEPQFWLAYQARKKRGWGVSYDPVQNLNHEYMRRTREVRWRDIGTGAYIGGATKNVRSINDPLHRGVVPISSVASRQ